MVAAPNNNNPLTFASIRALKSKYTHILSFTEPDINDFSVASAIDLYPSLIETGLKIGSPAPFNTTLVPGDWLYEFMSNITAKELPLDFIALHYFSNDFNVTAAVAKFKKYVESVFRMYRLPIWVTEYAMISFDHGVLPKQVKVPRVETQAQFATAATEMLNGLVFVERYAWFALPQN
ncbi:hypothetical protein MMC14_007073, partial [Varicellaria rhodocarpa]|nr:hypothetical protein [Varicellaria rhodocarpa]